MTIELKVILGTTRQRRFGDKPAHWICDEARRRPGVEVELVDLRDYPMPFFNEPISPAWGKGTYADETVQLWAGRVARGDAYIVVSPEYNHGYPAVLKNAFDQIYPEWANKPIGFLSYGGAGGARAIEQLRLVAIELQMWPIKSAIHLPVEVYLAVMNDPVPTDPARFEPLKKGPVNVVDRFFNELLWAARALKQARTAGA